MCDATKGLLRVDVRTGAIEHVTDRVAGVPMVFCNNAAIAGDGTVWFSDSSTRYGLDRLEGANSSRTPAPAACSG